jgi:uncharacterized 2Fe-2S/4Fe-4S cluster protein (DUF4445 family)
VSVLRVQLPERLVELPISHEHTLAEHLREHSVPLNTRCGGRGLCDGCQVRLGSPDGDVVQACQHRADVHDEIHVPQRSLARFVPQVESRFSIKIPFGSNPLATSRLGCAIDIGTTTVALLLIDLTTGKVLSTQSAFNEQIHLGEDVLTRISYCAGGPTTVRTLRDAIVVRTIRPLIRRALEEADAAASDLGVVTFSGNTTMLHLLLGIDPTSIGVAPFKPTFLAHRVERLRDLLGDAFQGDAHLLPGAAAYVGADVVAGVVVSGMSYSADTCLLVDVGTNGEIVLIHQGQFIGTATAAGPAFEGAGLSSGMRAGSGAICRIRSIDGRPAFDTIGHVSPRDVIGICGSAYVDLLCVGRSSGWINASGRLNRLHPSVVERDGERLLHLVTSKHGTVGVSERDIAKLLTAKSAIGAGITVLLRRFGLTADHMKRLYLAGGFGAHLDVSHAIACGMLPDFQTDQVEVVGNTSLAGAMAALLDRELLPHFCQVAKSIRPIELNQEPEFEDQFMMGLTL